MKKIYLIFILAALVSCNNDIAVLEGDVIPSSAVKDYVEKFNSTDDEVYKQFIPNSGAAEFLVANMPRFECPNKELEEIYYFRWWTFRKHIKQIPDGFIITEFLSDVDWAGIYNCEIGSSMHHYNEGRWLHDQRYMDTYAYFTMRGGSNLRAYSCHVARSIYDYYLVTGNDLFIREFVPDFIANFEEWEKKRFDPAIGLFWQFPGQDAMEMAICGDLEKEVAGYRDVINSYLIAEAQTIAKLAMRYNHPKAAEYAQKAAALHAKMLETLWDDKAQFFKVLPRIADATLCNARELHGYTPWCYNLADEKYAAAWQFLMDSTYFYAPYGPTTAERCHPGFQISYQGHECQWNGPSWPFSTCITLAGIANTLNSQQQNYITKKNYFDLLKIYAHSHHLTKEDGTVVPWIDENLNPFTGDWITRTRLKIWENGTWSAGKGGVERGKDYNHSTFCDLVITGLVGIRPQESDTLTINPLVPGDTWEYFCLENVLYRGHHITVVYDKSGGTYNLGKGLMVFVDGRLKGQRNDLGNIRVSLI
ncbi:MAG: hypothetical protein LBC40_07070 [Dysgonamonadaceae bacterium]|jgi:hypothetical protein|nr:hypothetical protein [Dysgonamonadaceae bacterium]